MFDIITMIHQERRAATCSWPSVRSRKCSVEDAPWAECVPSDEAHSETVTMRRPRTFGSLFLQASCFLHGTTHEEQHLCWQFIVCSSFAEPCWTLCGPNSPRLSSGLGGSVCSDGPEAEEDSEGYLRRKRCARMAASSGLTGVASCPRRLTGGMLPN